MTAERPVPGPPEPSATPDSEPVHFILQLARALHRYGYSSHRLEEVLEHAAIRLGLVGQFFSTPTAIFAAFGPLPEQKSFLLRAEPGEVNLEKLSDLEGVAQNVLHGGGTPAAGLARIREIVAAPRRYRSGLAVLAYGVSASSGAVLLGGGAREAAVSGMIGLLTGLLALLLTRNPRTGRVFEPAAAFTAAFLSGAAAQSLHGLDTASVTVASLLVVLPGLTLTLAMMELSSRHLVSGTTRLAGAFMLFLAIGFGVAMGNTVAGSLFGFPAPGVIAPLPPWTLAAGLLVGPLAFSVLFRAAPRDIPLVLAAGLTGFVGARLGGLLLGPRLGVFVGSLALGVASNLYSRIYRRPPTVTLVPGLILLVPGSIGFRSLLSLMGHEVVPGVETAFRMLLTASALAAGMLLANVVVPTRKVG